MYGLLGCNISYTYSPLIHNLLGYEYNVYDLAEDAFKEFMEVKNFKALNVTIPYKSAVIPYLDYIDEDAKALNVVNTIVNHEGKLYGYNTDTRGFDFALKYHNVDLKDCKVLILGTGNTAESIQSVISKYPITQLKNVGRFSEYNYNNLALVSDYDVIINTTPIGTHPNIDQSLVDLNEFSNLKAVIDVIYNPNQSKLVSAAKLKSINAYGGLLMLVAQAVYSSEYFFNQEIAEDKIIEIYKEVLNMQRNIVLIGMPSAGKSSIAKLLGAKLEREVYDLDSIIIERESKSIADIFKQDGEVFFRLKEAQVVEEVSKKTGAIIACGGGVIVDPQNMQRLMQNGLIVFVDRPLELLSITEDRPLSRSYDLLKELYATRIDLYHKYADITIENNASLEMAVQKIIEAIE